MKLKTTVLGLTLLAFALARPASATVNVQGWWHFDDLPGTTPNVLLDSSGNGRHYQQSFVVPVVYPGGTAPGGLVSSDAAGGMLGNSGYTSSHSLRLGLQGDSDTFWQTGYVPPATNYGVEIWVRPQNKGGFWRDGNPVWLFSSGGFNCCSGPWGGACVRVENIGPTGVIVAGIIVGANSVNVYDFGPQIPVDTNNWMHLALINTNGVVSFWTNGVLCAVNTAGNETAPAGVMHLGTDGAWDGFDGYIDEERVFTFTNASDFAVSDLLYTTSPRITRAPQSIAVWDSGAGTLQVGVSMDSCTTYQWHLNGTNAPGGTGADLYLNPVTAADSGKSFNVGVTNSCGGNGVIAGSATLTVVPTNPDNINAYRNAVNGEPSLVAYYPVDGNTGSTLTDTKGGHNGTFEGNANYDGQTNRAFGTRAVFINHGDGDVQIPASSVFDFTSGNGTVESIVYLQSPVTPEPGAYATIFSVASVDGTSIRYQLGVSVDGTTLLCTNDTGLSLTWPVAKSLLNRFAHVAFVFSGGTTVTAYVDGNSLGAKTLTAFGTGGVPAWIGFGPGLGSVTTGAPGYWYGTIDELAVYSSALAATNIAIHNSKFVFGTNTAPPTIASQPTSKTLYAGGVVSLPVSVAGTPPFTYQWTSNGVPVAGATGPTLDIANTSVGAATYRMYVTNVYGWTNTAPITLTFISPPAGYPSAVLSDHPAAYWRLADTAGPTAVDSAGGYDGTYSGSGVTYGVSGPPSGTGKAVLFDGAAGRVVVPYAPALNPTGPFTIEYWAKLTTYGFCVPVSSMIRPARSGGYEFYLAGNFSGYEFHTAANGGYNMITGDGTVPPTGVWVHVAGVWDGTSVLLYINGSLAGTNSAPPFVPNTSTPFYIGSRSDGVRYFNGAMSDVAFYNYALTPAQLAHHLAVGQPQKLAITPSSNVIADTSASWPPKDGLNDGATWLASSAGRSGVMQFNPTLTADNEITVFSYPQLANTNGTIMFWMRSSGVVPSGYNNGDDGCILLWRMPGVPGGGMFIGLMPDGRIQLQGGFNQPHCDSGATTVNNGAWHHVAMTFDTSSAVSPDLFLYVDGVQVGSGAAAYDWMWPNQNFTLQIGADRIGYDQYWNDYTGDLDEIRIYDKLLTPAEVGTAMSGGLVTTNLVLRYDFDTPPGGYLVTSPYGGLVTSTNVSGPYSEPGGLTNRPPYSSHSPFPVSKATVDRLGKQFFGGSQ